MADAATEGQLALCKCAQCVSLRTQKQLMCAHCGLWAYHAQPRDEFSAFDCTCLACSRTYCLVCAKTHAYRRLTQDGEPGDKDDQEYSLSCSRCSRSQEDRLFIDDADLLQHMLDRAGMSREEAERSFRSSDVNMVHPFSCESEHEEEEEEEDVCEEIEIGDDSDTSGTDDDDDDDVDDIGSPTPTNSDAEDSDMEAIDLCEAEEEQDDDGDEQESVLSHGKGRHMEQADSPEAKWQCVV